MEMGRGGNKEKQNNSGVEAKKEIESSGGQTTDEVKREGGKQQQKETATEATKGQTAGTEMQKEAVGYSKSMFAQY